MSFHSIEDPAKLRRLLEASLLIEGGLDLASILGRLIDEARSMTGARYGAIGVLSVDKKVLSDFITVGLDHDAEIAIGPLPTGKGVLGLLMSEPQTLRLPDLGKHPDSYGFPPNHPPMKSFLGVPIRLRDEVYGNLYLTDKIGWSEFTNDDASLVEALALAAGIAIENTHLQQQLRMADVYEDRDRLARDLHDTVIQRLFGVGLTLQSIAARSPSEIAPGLGAMVTEIDQVIKQVRSTIYELGLGADLRGVRDDILSLVDELTPVVGFHVTVSIDGPVDSAVSDTMAEHLMATIRESVTNIGRHANATNASVSLVVADGQCRLTVTDNGVGIGAGTSEASRGGLGLVNIRRRAEKLHGTLDLKTPEGGGTSLTWQVPVG